MKMGIIPKQKIFGSDIAGRVEVVGKNISRFAIGDEVFGDISHFGLGGFAEYVVVPEIALALKPAGVTLEAAASVLYYDWEYRFNRVWTVAFICSPYMEVVFIY